MSFSTPGPGDLSLWLPPGVDPDSLDSVESVFAARARALVSLLAGPGGRVPPGVLDFTPSSLGALDTFLGEVAGRAPQWIADPKSLDVVAAYLGEVIRTQYGGRYLRGDERNEFYLVIGEGPRVGVAIYAKVKGRVENGSVDSLPFFYDGIGPAIARGVDVTIF